MSCPRITIVTPVFNRAKYLRETMESVFGQDYQNLEYIVVDGGSTDGSVEIIREYESRLAHWISEPDEGQSDALRKGFAHATGEWVTWLNSDDVLLPGTLHTVARAASRNPQRSWIVGNVIWIDTSGAVIRCSRLPSHSHLLAAMGTVVVGGPSTFFKRALYARVHGIRKELYFKMDNDLWWQFCKAGVYYHRVPRYLMAFRVHEESKTSCGEFAAANESSEYAKRVQAEWDQFCARYFSRMSRFYRPIGRRLYRLRQLLNGNYYRAWRDLRRLRGRHWREVSPARAQTT